MTSARCPHDAVAHHARDAHHRAGRRSRGPRDRPGAPAAAACGPAISRTSCCPDGSAWWTASRPRRSRPRSRRTTAATTASPGSRLQQDGFLDGRGRRARTLGCAPRRRPAGHQHVGHPARPSTPTRRAMHRARCLPASTTPMTHSTAAGGELRARSPGLAGAELGRVHGLFVERQGLRRCGPADRIRPGRRGGGGRRRQPLPAPRCTASIRSNCCRPRSAGPGTRVAPASRWARPPRSRCCSAMLRTVPCRWASCWAWARAATATT